MAAPATEDITELLRAWEDGDRNAFDKLTPLIHVELRKAAHRYMAREQPGHTLQTTALVNEVYLRLLPLRKGRWQNRAHFFAICARLMRHTLTDMARARQRLKRGGGVTLISFGEEPSTSRKFDANVLALDEALSKLAEFDPRKSQVIEMRFFGGLNVKEVAEVLKISERTVANEWRLARAWLLRELGGAAREDSRS